MQAVIERIEGNIAVLEIEGKVQIELPVKFLPRGVRDGTVLKMSFEIDRISGQERGDKAREIQERLKNRK
ncbi:MAG: DUF3006 domain-containing protein [bacterium]|nr:DUF3006 domain-containing protein [bacterium]